MTHHLQSNGKEFIADDASNPLSNCDQRFKTIFENAGVGISEVGPDNRILLVNDRQCEITGRTREELIANDSCILWHPDDALRCRQLQADLRAGRIESFTDERRYLKPSGEVVWVRVNARRLPAEGIAPPKRIAIVEDITEKVNAELRLKESEEALRVANEQLEAQVHKRTHELARTVEALQAENTLRVKIERDLRDHASQLRALARELTLTEQRERRQLADILHDNLQQLLVSAKLQLGGLQESSPNGVAEIMEILSDAITVTRSLSAELSPPVLHEGGLVPALEWLSRWAKSKYHFEVHCDLPGESPDLPEDAKVLLFESVRELIFNAVKHSQVQAAFLSLETSGESITIELADHGAGFDMPSVMESGKNAGGYGLFSIRERLSIMGGSFEMESAIGRGSRFGLKLRRSGATGSVHKTTVVLVDDHAIMREGLARLLGQEPDIEIIGQAGNGLAALTLAEKRRPDVILMDINMPTMNGIEATRIIHARYPEICIIGLSMHDDTGMAQQMLAAGAAHFTYKGNPACELKSLIRGRQTTASCKS